MSEAHRKYWRGISVIVSEVIVIATLLIFIILAINWIWGIWRVEQYNFMVVPHLLVKVGGLAVVILF